MGPSTGLFDVGGQRLVTPPIRGRAGELKVIGALVTALVQGRGGVLVIEGPPGIGKSRLLTEVMALADKSGVRTLFGEAFEYQQTVPFFSLFMATLRADPPVGDADALRRLGGSADLRYWVVHDLADAIHAAAAQTPLAIVLEDIHWADNSTLLALRSLATARPDVAVLWVLTARTGAGGPAVQETLSVLQRADAAVLRVAAMSPGAVADMVCDAVRANADASLLNLAAKAHGNPFLVRELVGGLGEEGRLNVSGGRAVATGHGLPRRLGAGMQQRLDLLSTGAGEVVRVAAVLPDRFSAGLLAAMLERQPASLMSAVEEAVRADLLVEDGEQLRFRHDLLREATRQSLPQSLRRAMERQSASIMLSMGAAPAEVATQLARSAEPGDREAISALRQAAQSVGHSDASAAADLSRRALELLPADDADHGLLVAETVGLLNRASRYQEAEELAVAALSEVASPQEEAEIRLRLATLNKHSTQRRVEENRRALQLGDISEVTRARHLAWLAYNLMLQNQRGERARRPTRLPRPRHRPVISRPRSWPTSPSLCSTVGRGTRAARYAASRSFARSPARVMRPQLMTWPQSTTRSCWRWSAGWTTLRPRSPTEQSKPAGKATRWPLISGPRLTGLSTWLRAGCLLRAPRPNPCRPHSGQA